MAMAIRVATGMGRGGLKGVAVAAGRYPHTNRAHATTMRMPHVVFAVCGAKAYLSLRLCRGVPLVQDLRGGFPVRLEEGNRPRPKENPVDRAIDLRVGESSVVGRSLFLLIGWLCLGHSVALPGMVEGIDAVAIADLRDEDGFVDLDR